MNKFKILNEKKKFRILKPARAKAAAGGGQLPLFKFNRIIRSKNGPENQIWLGYKKSRSLIGPKKRKLKKVKDIDEKKSSENEKKSDDESKSIDKYLDPDSD